MKRIFCILAVAVALVAFLAVGKYADAWTCPDGDNACEEDCGGTGCEDEGPGSYADYPNADSDDEEEETLDE